MNSSPRLYWPSLRARPSALQPYKGCTLRPSRLLCQRDRNARCRALAAYTPQVRAALQAAGARPISRPGEGLLH
jgi:hypothetical protein